MHYRIHKYSLTDDIVETWVVQAWNEQHQWWLAVNKAGGFVPYQPWLYASRSAALKAARYFKTLEND